MSFKAMIVFTVVWLKLCILALFIMPLYVYTIKHKYRIKRLEQTLWKRWQGKKVMDY